jgi:uncharacterized DUF497 family protein
VSDLRFQWDPNKAATNIRKHRVSFDEAATVFDDPQWHFEEDIGHSDREDRFKAIGISKKNRLLTVVYTSNVDAIRIISADKAKAAEKAAYTENLR